MKSVFNNQVQKVRDGVNDLLHTNREPQHYPQTSTIPSGAPTYYHLSSNPSPVDPYSHTAHSTAGFSQTGTYPTLASYNQPADRQSFLGKVESTATNLLGNVVGQDTIVSVTNKLNDTITSGRHVRELLRNGAIVQLLSKNSHHLLQILVTPNGILTFDGNGTNNSFNTYFTIEEGEKGRFRFHNSYNYLAFDGKQPCIISLAPGYKNNPAIDFRAQDILGSNELIALESCACKNHFISISPDGYLKTTNIKDKTIDAQFSVIPVPMNQPPMYPYQAQPYQQFNMNPPNGASGFMPSQPPMYNQEPSAPPPPYSTLSPSSQPSASSSGLYPKFN
jgi:hypothetical protein